MLQTIGTKATFIQIISTRYDHLHLLYIRPILLYRNIESLCFRSQCTVWMSSGKCLDTHKHLQYILNMRDGLLLIYSPNLYFTYILHIIRENYVFEFKNGHIHRITSYHTCGKRLMSAFVFHNIAMKLKYLFLRKLLEP